MGAQDVWQLVGEQQPAQANALQGETVLLSSNLYVFNALLKPKGLKSLPEINLEI